MKNLIDNLDEPFSEILLKLIDTKDMTDVAVNKSRNRQKAFCQEQKRSGIYPKKEDSNCE